MKNLGLIRKSENGKLLILYVENPSIYFAQLLESFLRKAKLEGRLLMNYSIKRNGVTTVLGYESRTKDPNETRLLLENLREFFRKFFPTRFAEIFLEKSTPEESSSNATD